MDETRANYVKRAFAAYFKNAIGPVPKLPNGFLYHTENEKDYVGLFDGKEILACYRVRNDGSIKKLAVKYPKGLLQR